jgi:ABC-type Mn2+/Zn2+ transport system permease subunit
MTTQILSTPSGFLTVLATLAAIGTACAVLSIFVVLLKWSFMGEGISHAGLGGYGTAAVLFLAAPAYDTDLANFAVAVTFCFATAVAIAWFSRRRAVSSDAAIGAVMLASLAWGYIAFAIHAQVRHASGVESGWDAYLIGSIERISIQSMFGAGIVAAVVLLTIALLAKQILAFCLDPVLAQVSGIPAAALHYLLALLLALVIIAGMPLLGNLLAPALVILPGALALALSQRLTTVITISISATLTAILIGLGITAHWPFVPAGPAIVLALFAEFLTAISLRRK